MLAGRAMARAYQRTVLRNCCAMADSGRCRWPRKMLRIGRPMGGDVWPSAAQCTAQFVARWAGRIARHTAAHVAAKHAAERRMLCVAAAAAMRLPSGDDLRQIVATAEFYF
ncbi:hypothetical protein F511_47155 [Dorcoceras hygrometricum]|uniref:Uncharacterized protein n=1 Tax=Dorcoceras hygrometricum TaxID=472368 RepID=A0A2Z6ZZ13_9LAMI|nr:hypothetical protein F511_47155 [Dorcoceras hygrometricum]